MSHPITAEQIDRALDAAFAPPKKKPHEYEAYAKYAKCCEMGLSKAETARALGVSKASVYCAAKRFRLKFTPAQRGPQVGAKYKPRKPRVNPFIAKMAEMAAAENAALRRASQ